MPDTGHSWRYAKINGQWYYDLKRIPNRDKLPKNLMEQWAALDKASDNKALETQFKDAIKEWRQYLTRYEDHNPEQAQRLCEACAALDFLVRWQSEQGLSPSKLSFYAEAGALIGKHGVYLPDNYRRLQEKVLSLYGGAQSWEVVKLRRAGNSNATKFSDPQVVAWAMVMRMSGHNFTNTHIIRQVQTMCLLRDKPTPSTSWMEKLLAAPENKYLSPTRWGANGRKMMNHKGYIPMQGACFAGDCWLMDGTRMNLIAFKHKWTTKGGVEREGYAHLTVVVVFDEMSGMFVSREYGIAESEDMYQNALAKAVQKTGYLPYELVTDRFPGHNTDGWQGMKNKLEKAGTKVSETHEMEGKARLERAIRTLQDVAMQSSPYYYGEGIQSTNEYAHRSEEVLKAVKKMTRDDWGLDECVAECERIFECYNNMRYSVYSRERRAVDKSPFELHTESQKPHTAKYDPMEALQWWGRTKQVQLTHQGMLITEVMGAKYHFVIDPEKHFAVIKRYQNRPVTVHYDLEDLGRVVLSDPDTERVLCEALVQNRVQIRGPQADMGALGTAKRRLDRIRELTEHDAQQYYDLAANEEAVLYPQIAGKGRAGDAETAMLVAGSKQGKTKKESPQSLKGSDGEDGENEHFNLTYQDIIGRL